MQRLNDFRRGDTIHIAIQYPAGTDITGFKFWLTLKTSLDDDDDDAVLQISTVAGDTEIDDEENGLVYLVIPAEDSAELVPGQYYIDIQALSASGDVTTLYPPPERFRDKIAVVSDVTMAVE